MLLGLLVACAAVAVYVTIRNGPPPRPRATSAAPAIAPQDLSPPALSASRFLNTGPDARYVGTDACAECHRANHRSYLLTAHSRALGDLDVREEPPDGSFFHQASGRSYRVYRQPIPPRRGPAHGAG